MKKLWWIPVALGLARFAAAEDSVTLTPTALELPARIGPMRIEGEPYRYQPASLGTSWQYLGRGLSLTVYVYDAEVADIPDGGDTMPTCKQFEEAKHDVLNAGYGNARLVSQRLVRLLPPDDAPLVREASFEYVREGHPTVSYLWVTGFGKNFVKLRFSLDANLRDEAGDARSAVLGALGAALKPHVVPEDPHAKKSGPQLNLVSGSQDDMAAGFTYVLVQSMLLEKLPEEAPICGGQYFPSYPVEVATLRGMIEMQKSGMKGAFAQRLAEIDAAGFLGEFAWQDMHREWWGKSAPDDLKLGEYKTWKKKHLKGFKPPALGGVAINQPRPMPIESLDTP
jgi:hypothetical protein